MTQRPNDSCRFVGLIGLGYWGQNILRNLHQIGVLHTACDDDAKTLEERRAKFPGINYTTSFEDVLKSRDVKAVAIATPAATHYDFVKRVLMSGKDVFVEKPLALKVEEGQELVNLAEERGRILMVGHILQYHPAVIKLKEVISGGALGKIQYIYSNRLNIGKLRTEENILWSFAPHDISVILMLLGEEPVKVSAFGGDYINQGVCDTTLTSLEFRNGVKGHIFVSWIHPYKEQKLIVVGSKAMAVFDDVSKEKLFLYPHRIEWQDGKIPVAQKAEYQSIPADAAEPLKEELKHFADCVLHRTRPRTDGHEGLRVLRILESAEKSINTHSVTLSLEPSALSFHSSPLHAPSLEPSTLSFHSPPLHAPGSMPYFIHESAYVDEEVEIGEGTKIWYFSHILKGSKIGKNCIIGQNVMIGPNVSIGDRCKIQNNVSLYTGVTLEDEVFCGPSCVFTNVYNPRAFIERKHEFKPTLVKRGATVGANATIVCGTTIGKYAMIGSGAVIKSDVPDHAVMAGVPAKRIGWACKCGTTLRFDHDHAKCSYCRNEYTLVDGILKE